MNTLHACLATVDPLTDITQAMENTHACSGALWPTSFSSCMSCEGKKKKKKLEEPHSAGGKWTLSQVLTELYMGITWDRNNTGLLALLRNLPVTKLPAYMLMKWRLNTTWSRKLTFKTRFTWSVFWCETFEMRQNKKRKRKGGWRRIPTICFCQEIPVGVHQMKLSELLISRAELHVLVIKRRDSPLIVLVPN